MNRLGLIISPLCLSRKQTDIVANKKNSDERLIVVARRPGQRRKLIVAAALVLLLIAMLFYYIGFVASLRIQGEAREQNLILQQQLAELKLSYSESRREAAQAQVALRIDKKATEQVRQLILELEQQLSEQKEEITFYKGLMAPSEKEKGLGIRSWELEYSGDGRYEYRLTVQQLAAVHRLVKGYVSINVVGMQNGEQQVHSLRNLSQQVKDEKIKLRFKYFQMLSGEFNLPAGFKAQRVDIVAHSSGKKPQIVERSFDWLVQEN